MILFLPSRLKGRKVKRIERERDRERRGERERWGAREGERRGGREGSYKAAVSQQSLEVWMGNKLGFPGGSAVMNLPANAGDASSLPRSERSPAEGNGNRLQDSCL